MTLLIDEDVPKAVADFLRQRGHEVQMADQIFPKSTPDPVIAKQAELDEAIVVSCNVKHFERLLSKVPKAGKRAGVHRIRTGTILFYKCQAQAAARIRMVIDRIEADYVRTATMTDRRFMVRIRTNSYEVFV
jgi:predicted nuclease of predicted toxin-antitoxin system